MDRQAQEEFIQFLEDNDALDDFKDALKAKRRLYLRQYLNSYHKRDKHVLLNAFIWGKESEYWMILDDKWRKYIDNEGEV